MASNPTSTGMGQGSAQVFGQNPAVNQYVSNLRLGLQQEMRGRQEAQKLLSVFDTQRDKMRPQDLPEFNAKYSELRSLYTNNKGLYSNPTRYPELVDKANTLMGELRQLATSSRQQNEYFRQITTAKLNNPDLFDDDTTNRLEYMNSLPTSSIIKEVGSLVDPMHVSYQPKPVDWDKFSKGLYEFASNNGGIIKEQELVNMGRGYMEKVERERMTPEAARAYAAMQFDYGNTTFRKNMIRAANEITQPELQQMQQQLDSYMGDKTFDIDSPEKLAQAVTVLQFRGGKENRDVVSNKEWDWAQRRTMQDRDFANRVRLKGMGSGNEDKLAQDAAGFEQLLGTGDVANIQRGLGPLLNQFAPMLSGKPVVMTRQAGEKRGLTREQFIRDVQKYNKEAHDSFKMSDRQIEEAWDNGEAIMSIPVKVKSEKDEGKMETRQILVTGASRNRRDGGNRASINSGLIFSVLKGLKAPEKGVERPYGNYINSIPEIDFTGISGD